MVKREAWGTRVGLVLAMAGNAVGLGNFLRFPAQAVQNGGGAFILPYLVSFLLMGLPLLWVEWAVGRHGGARGQHGVPGILQALGPQPWLKYIGVFGLFTNLCIAAYYCYIESWTLAYVFHSLVGTFRTVAPTDFFPEYLGLRAARLTSLPLEASFWFLLTLALNVWILSKGLQRGIERAAKVGMPLLLLFGVCLVLRGLSLRPGDPGVVQSPMEGLAFVWHPRVEGLANPSTWMAAAGQVFFTLSVGMGCVHCYASYVGEREDIALNAAAAGWMNEFVEVVLGGSLLIPIAVAYLGLGPTQASTAGGSGFSLGFLSLPTLFNHWGAFAPLAGMMWFGLLFFAGITSSLAMGQPVMAFLQDAFRVSHGRSALAFGGLVLLLGAYCVWLYPGGAFDEFDFWTGTFSLVVFALLEALVFSFVFGMERGWAEITRGADLRVPRLYRGVIRYVTPLFILLVLAGSVLKPAGNDWGGAWRGLWAGRGWTFAPDGVVGRLLHTGDAEYRWMQGGAVTPAFVQDATRVLLLLLFLACAWAVWRAFRGTAEGGRA